MVRPFTAARMPSIPARRLNGWQRQIPDRLSGTVQSWRCRCGTSCPDVESAVDAQSRSLSGMAVEVRRASRLAGFAVRP